MSGTGAGYDQSVSQYSPDGRVYQIEYACKAVDSAATSVGIQCKDGVVMGCEKLKLSKMLVEGTNRRIFPVAKHVGMAVGGIVADGRSIVSRARQEAQNHRSTWGADMTLDMLCERIAAYKHMHTTYAPYRPFGASVLAGGIDCTNGPSLYVINPVGESVRYLGTAIGKGRATARTEIEKIQADGTLENLMCKDAIKIIAKILHKAHDEKDKDFELEMSWICPETNNTHQLVPKEIVCQAEEQAKEELEDEDDE